METATATVIDGSTAMEEDGGLNGNDNSNKLDGDGEINFKSNGNGGLDRNGNRDGG